MAKHAFKTAVVTGSGSGLGRAIALQLAKRGVNVVVSDLSEGGMAETVAMVEAAGGRASAMAADVTDPAAHEALRDHALDTFGGLDLWVNNAGVAVAGQVGDMALEDWHWVLDVNLRGMVYGSHVAAPHLKAQGHGAIINVASAAGLMTSPGMGAYCASKKAVVALSEALYAEFLPLGLGCTVVCPTFFQTNLLAAARSSDPKLLRFGAKAMKTSRVQADDVARQALDDAERGRLYSVAMTDGKVFWALNRLMPERFYTVVPWVTKRLMRRR